MVLCKMRAIYPLCLLPRTLKLLRSGYIKIGNIVYVSYRVSLWIYIRKKIYSIQMPQAVILDLDSTPLDAYGRQEGRQSLSLPLSEQWLSSTCLL